MVERYFVTRLSPGPEVPAPVYKDSQPCGVTLAAITVYPIKSCGGFAADHWEVGDKGLRCAATLYQTRWHWLRLRALAHVAAVNARVLFTANLYL